MQNGPREEYVSAEASITPLSICVVIPAFRAAPTIRSVIAGVPKFVRHIVVVDDCSPDETVSEASSTGDHRVRVLKHKENQGVGGATWSGYEEALRLNAAIVVKMDADGQMDPDWLPALVAPIVSGRADYAKGNRFLHLRELGSMPLLRRIGNTGLSFLTKIASGYWGIFDPANGYTALSSRALSRLDRRAIDARYFFETSLLIELGLVRAAVTDVYIPARYGSEVSGLSEVRALIGFPGRLLLASGKRVLLQHFVRDFGLLAVFLSVGSGLVSFGLTFGLWHWYLSGKAGVATPAGTVMIAAMCLILGIQCLLQAVLLDVQAQPKEPLSQVARMASMVEG